MSDKATKIKYNISQWDQHKLNYWAIPKCANTAIKASLANIKHIPKHTHSKLKWVHNPNKVNYISQEVALQNGYLNFSVVKHPYERFISLYKDQGLRRPAFKDVNLTVDKFLELMVSSNKINTDPHFRPMSTFLVANEKLLIDKILNIKDASSFLNQYNLLLNVVNKTKDLDIKLTKKQKEKIYNIYKDDFKYLGFTK